MVIQCTLQTSRAHHYSNLVSSLEFNLCFLVNPVSGSTFLVKRSYSFANDLFRASDNNLIPDWTFLDYAKAFDTVSHTLLKITKLSIQYTADSNILDWI